MSSQPNPLRTWVLGAPDPEMAAIEALLRECGETVVHATVNGQRVHPGNAYRADCPAELQGGLGEQWDAVYRVECSWDQSLACVVTTIDHHRPGDPGRRRVARWSIATAWAQGADDC